MKRKEQGRQSVQKDDSYSIDCNDWYSWNRDVHEYCMELCSTRDCKGVVDLLCLI